MSSILSHLARKTKTSVEFFSPSGCQSTSLLWNGVSVLLCKWEPPRRWLSLLLSIWCVPCSQSEQKHPLWGPIKRRKKAERMTVTAIWLLLGMQADLCKAGGSLACGARTVIKGSREDLDREQIQPSSTLRFGWAKGGGCKKVEESLHLLASCVVKAQTALQENKHRCQDVSPFAAFLAFGIMLSSWPELEDLMCPS